MLQIMLDAVEEVKGIFLITADHGNAEDMVKRNLKTGKPELNKEGKTEVLTSHTCNPVSTPTSCAQVPQPIGDNILHTHLLAGSSS